MAPHIHSTLSDHGIGDDDLRDMESQQGSRHLSRGSIQHSRIPPRTNVQEFEWEFREDAALRGFSSAQPQDEQLPETVPIPSQPEIRIAASETIEGRSRLDCSETCSTTNRSTPFNISDAVDGQFEFDFPQSEISQPADLLGEQSGEASKGTQVPPKRLSEQRRKKPYNTRSGPKVSYADGESSSDEDDGSEASLSPVTVSCSRAQKAQKKPKDKAPKPAQGTSPKNKRLEEQDESQCPQAAEKRKKKQRPKTPLRIDDETQRVPITVPTTPPVTDQRPKKRQRHQPQQPAVTKPKPRGKNKEPDIASPVAAPITNSPELGSEQSAQVASSARSENRPSQRHEHAYPAEADQNEEELDDSSIAESTHSTQVTTPSVLPSPRRISSMQVPIPSRQPPPPPSLPPLVFEDVQDSVESIPATRPPLMGDLSILMSRNASRGDEDIGHRLQEIHKRIGLYLQDKEKDVGSVASVYCKNGTGIVDRLQRRFTKEYHTLLRKLQEDKDAFNKSLGSAKRSLREGARDRQRVLKELDRNTKKRQQSCSKEVGRIKEIAKRIHNRGEVARSHA